VIRTIPYRKAALQNRNVAVAVSVARYALAGLVVATALAVPAGVLVVRASDNQAARSFEAVAAVAAGSVVAPLVTPALRQGQPAALDLMNRRVAALIAAGSVSQVTVRDADGQLLWPRNPGGPAAAAPLGTSERQALHSASVVSATDGSGDRPRTAAVGIGDANGTPTLVEVSDRTDSVSVGPMWMRAARPALAALLALEVVQVPLAYGLVRRSRRNLRTEASLAAAVADATATERRRVAGVVHDYVIPEMTGLAYDLDASRLGAPGADAPSALVGRSARGLRQCIGELRLLLSDLVQTRAPSGGLDTALRVLGDQMGDAETGVSVQVQAPKDLPRPVAELLYRCAQESLRNVATHSRAEQVEIVVQQDGRRATMTIDDDGCGFDETRMAERQAGGHVGLRTLGNLVADGGGSLTARSAPGQGTRLTITVPLTPAPGIPEPVR
jgi:signal transduction histidine kinase